MENHFVKTTFRIFIDYIITVFLFCVFVISILLIATQETARAWLIGYSLVWFLMLMMMTYSRVKQIAQKEAIPQYELNPYPLKGFVYGLAAMIPNFVVALINHVLIFQKEIFNARKLLVVKLVFAPLHPFVELFGDTYISFYLACLVVPIICGLGYLAGHYGIYPLARFVGKSKK